MPKKGPATTVIRGKHFAQTTFSGPSAFAAMAREMDRASARAATDLRRSAPLRRSKSA